MVMVMEPVMVHVMTESGLRRQAVVEGLCTVREVPRTYAVRLKIMSCHP